MAVVRLATLPDGEALSALMARLESLEQGGASQEGGAPQGGGGGGSSGPSTGGSKRGGDGGTARARRRAAEQEAAPAQSPAPRGLSPQEEAQRKKEARSHPVVLEAIEVLDAELRQIRTPVRDEPSSP
jgi:hypothetical protein